MSLRVCGRTAGLKADGPTDWIIAVRPSFVDGQNPEPKIVLMGREISSVLVVVLSVMVVPALCMGGVLLHPCDCCHEDDCGHEDACASDPCSEWVVRHDDFTHGFTETQPAPAGQANADPARISYDDAFRGERRIPVAPPRPMLPFPASDLPLLI